jgi:hypothetical protein
VTTVTCVQIDAHSNTGSVTFTVSVMDSIPPSAISAAPASQTIEAPGSSGAVATFTYPTYTDIYDGADVFDADCDYSSGDTFPIGATSSGVTTVTCTAVDRVGNAGPFNSFTITVQDTTAPSIASMSDMTVEATGPSGAVATWAVAAGPGPTFYVHVHDVR